MASLGETVEPPASAGAAAGPLRRSIWPAIHPRLLELVQSHQSTLIFANARRLAERLAARLNELHLEAQAEADEDERARIVEGDRSGGPVRVGDLLSGPAFAGHAENAEKLGQIGQLGEGVPAGAGVSPVAPPVPLGDEQVGAGGDRGRGACQGPSRLGVASASPADRGRAQTGGAAGPGGHIHARAGHRHGRGGPGGAGGLARIGGLRVAAHRPGRAPGGRAEPGSDLPQAPRRPAGGGCGGGAHAPRRGGAHPLPAEPHRRGRPADRGHVCHGRLARRASGGGAAALRRLRGALRRGAAQRAGAAVGHLPGRGVLRAQAPRGMGSGRRRAAGPGRGAEARRDQRGHHPRPGPVRRVPARRDQGGRARRGDGLREPGGRDVPAGRDHLAHHGHHLRAGGGDTRARRTGQDAVLARRRARPPHGAGPRRGAVGARAALRTGR